MTQDEIEKQKLLNENKRLLKEKALRILSRRDHSISELKRKLSQKKVVFNHETFDHMIEELRRLEYLADENVLAERHLKQWRSEGRGRMWISGKLKTMGLPVPQMSDDDQELENGTKFLDKKFKKIKTQAEKAKAYRSLMSRGFSSSIASTAINNFSKKS